MKEITIKVIYEDGDVIVISKPSGMLSGRKEGSSEKSALDAAGEICLSALFPVHRLDRLTSGIMIFAKNKDSAAFLSSGFEKKTVKKTYFAAVHGSAPEKGECEDFLFFDRRKDKSFIVKKEKGGAKRAHLTYEKADEASLPSGEKISLLKVYPTTGRSHQIRVQLAGIGHPLLGDGKYGSRFNGCPAALHSHKIDIDFSDFPGVCASLKKHTDDNPSLLSSFPDADAVPWNLFPSLAAAKK